jgi:ElaB/YqjD/DUF883 family membrane-anchored ribosome-binding protein
MDDRETFRSGTEPGRPGEVGSTRPGEAGGDLRTGTDGLGTGATGGAGQFGSTASGSGRTPTGDVDVRAGAYDRKFQDDDSVTDRIGDKLEEGRERISETLEEGRDRAQSALDTGRNRVADQLERVGDRIEDRARAMEDAGGVQRRAGTVARRTSEALDTSADYLRTHDASEMRDDLEHAIRERPLMSVGVALGAGFLLARILRD